MGSLPFIQPWTSRRSSSFEPRGGNEDFWSLAPGETRTIFEAEGAGVVRHIWMTLFCPLDPQFRKKLVLRAFWDGQDHPSIESPVGDFFGQGWGETYPLMSAPFANAPDQGRAHVCYLPMPFGRGARIELENQSEAPIERLYFYIDSDSLPSLPENMGRLHAQYRQELTSPDTEDGRENEWFTLRPYEDHPSGEGNYLWCEAEGEGHFVGVHYYVNCPTPMWYGEGDDLFLIDGAPWPGLSGTGTEDYFNTSWSPDSLFQHPAFGIAYAPDRVKNEGRLGWLGRTHLYRFHLDDPIRFSKSLHASIEHGHANCLTLDLASVAFWYQTLPSRPLAPLPLPQDRLPKPPITPSDIHRWRDAWLRKHGFGWGETGPWG